MNEQPPVNEMAAIRRPNGKLYRPRKVSCHAVNDENLDLVAVIVFGTHDIERARPLAEDCVRYWSDEDCAAAEPVTGWWRDGYANGGRGWVNDSVAGRAGVWFEAVPDGMEEALTELGCRRPEAEANGG